jgi:predicted Zn-dependent protease
MEFRRLLGGLSVLLLLATGGCATNPVTGKSEISLVSPAQEVALGEQNYQPSQQTQGGQYIIDPALQNYVSSIGQKLAAVSDRPGLPWEFVVLDNSVPNAWALPGGKIAINRGLLIELQDEAELAAVLGHEVVHAAARHSAAQMTRGTLVGMTGQIAAIASQTAGYGELGGMAAQASGAAFMAKYGRDDELEADQYGMKYMVRAGYDPQAAVRLQETFVRLSAGRQSDFISGLFASHPPSQARVDANKRHAAEYTGGVTNRSKYQSMTAQIRRDKPAYDAQDQALAALKKKQPKQALALLDKAIKIQPAESQFWELRGHAWQMLKNPGNAEKAYTTAINKNPKLFSPQLYRGLLRYEQSNFSGAQQDLYLSHRLLPTPVSAYYLGDLALQRGENEAALTYFGQAAGSGSKEIAAQAQRKMVPLEIGQKPDKYIASRAYLGKDGYLHVTVKNNAGLDVNAVQLQLIEGGSFSQGRARSLKGSYSLSAGQQIDVNTGIGPFEDASQAPQYRSRVSSARVAQ